MNQEEFLIQHLTEGKSYAEIADKFHLKREQLSEWWETGIALRQQIKKSNQIFNSKQGKDEFKHFEKLGKREFFEWYQKQPRKCGYCEIEEYKLIELFDGPEPFLKTKRHRGKSLELERKDTKNLENIYTEKNCILVCYLCNNHKSDLISEKDHMTFFAKNIREYLETKYSEMKAK